LSQPPTLVGLRRAQHLGYDRAIAVRDPWQAMRQ
jgi:hypothetical protein